MRQLFPLMVAQLEQIPSAHPPPFSDNPANHATPMLQFIMHPVRLLLVCASATAVFILMTRNAAVADPASGRWVMAQDPTGAKPTMYFQVLQQHRQRGVHGPVTLNRVAPPVAGPIPAPA